MIGLNVFKVTAKLKIMENWKTSWKESWKGMECREEIFKI